MSSHVPADSRLAPARSFDGEPYYVEGYVPSSYDAPHSALLRSSTWIGMGMILSSVIGIGTWVFGLGVQRDGIMADNGMTFVIIGVVLMLALWIGGAALIYSGRKGDREYKARTGRH
ncbi:hypothetical protein ACFPVT_04775 [Corynebacterium choanae]|uniref:Uncharacterized protein n=1 Tax=Corynebacterium choanae TaxID=1862358 RepID=A0A3G6J9D6_9CORY|nr:hypothetical protein [Corynebacterium choanae]AZA14519.1 hypothetical protein CCHOA_10700 [Corynebacterium choanae]